MKFQINSVIEKILFYIQVESFITLGILWGLGFVFYYFFLKSISDKRHRNLRRRFKNAGIHFSISAALALLQWGFLSHVESSFSILIFEYVAFLALIFGALATVKIAQIIVYLGLFYNNISQGIPRLIVNLFTVVFSLFVFSMLASEVFSIHISAMLATSAVFSLVLGLALQDTLGNLFSGVAMQIGQAFKIGDWIEVRDQSKVWLGQVQEVTWRSTFILTFSDEMVMIPNKVIAQSEITIFSGQAKPSRENLTFRLDFDQDICLAKKLIRECVSRHPSVSLESEPRVLLTETTESWLTLKVFYSLTDFSLRYRVADALIESVIAEFRRFHIHLATPKMTYLQAQSPSATVDSQSL